MTVRDDQMKSLISGCIKQDRNSQRKLYQQCYSYAMSICMRYSNGYDDAVEVLNDAFMKVFTHIGQFDQSRSFKSWLRVVLINTALDHYRTNKKHNQTDELEAAWHCAEGASAESQLAYEDLLALVSQLSPAYRTVFNLYVIDGYKHQEIAKMLDISVGTSKANLTKAKANLRNMLQKYQLDERA